MCSNLFFGGPLVDKRNRVFYSETDTPIGPLLVATTSKGLCYIDFGKGNKSLYNLQRWSKKWLKHELVESNSSFVEPVVRQIQEFLQGQRTQFDVELDFYGTPFQKMVWQVLTDIPYGETRSYKQVASDVGIPKAVRAVGGANNKNPIPIIVPCHRVIGSNGALVGYGGGLSIKEYLLNLEKQETKIL
jgi:methylated-DNA-[protein]-cysteine S-methyltransferase